MLRLFQAGRPVGTTRRVPFLKLGLAVCVLTAPIVGCAIFHDTIPPGPAWRQSVRDSDEALREFLEPTSVIDSDNAAVMSMATELANGADSPRKVAVRIHDFVRDDIDFGFPPSFYATSASKTLQLGRGYCVTKSTLVTALLRAAGVPARIHFVDLDAALLSGFLDPGTPYVDHCFVEIFLGDRWVSTDSFIVDPPLREAALAKLRETSAQIGYGIHLEGTGNWNGRDDAFSQFVEDTAPSSGRAFSTRDYGVHSDILALHRDAPEVWNRRGWGLRMFGSLAFGSINRKIESLRATATAR